MYKGLTEAKCPRCIVTKIEPVLSDHLRRGWLRFWRPSPPCLCLIYPSNTLLSPPFWPVRDQNSITHQLRLAHLPSNFDHMRHSESLTSSNFVYVSSKFDDVIGEKALESSNFVHVRGKKTRASSKFDHVRGKKALESSNFDHARRYKALASSKFVRTYLIFSRTPKDQPRR